LQPKLHKDNSLLVQNLIATFKPNHKEMIRKIIAGGLRQSSSGIDVSITVEFFYVKSKISHVTM
jgi:hypothetical protein